jgi:alpha-D-ribose 1-methylphosphonate 5-triphosphate synthase subunit PhnG
MTDALTRERRAELLAASDPIELAALAERCLETATPTLVAGPEVGMVMLQVREPVARERFYLGEVLVTRAEVDLDGARGWAMVMGSDRVRALAAAVCDAEAQGGRARAIDVHALCRSTERTATDAEDRERAELAATEVAFEEL